MKHNKRQKNQVKKKERKKEIKNRISRPGFEVGVGGEVARGELLGGCEHASAALLLAPSRGSPSGACSGRHLSRSLCLLFCDLSPWSFASRVLLFLSVCLSVFSATLSVCLCLSVCLWWETLRRRRRRRRRSMYIRAYVYVFIYLYVYIYGAVYLYSCVFTARTCM